MSKLFKCILFIQLTMTTMSSWAVNYISDVAITGCFYKKQINDAKNQMRNAGYTVIDLSVNEGTPGATYYFIYLGYKTTTDPKNAITLLACTTSTTDGSSSYDNIEYDGLKYKLQPAQRFYNSNGDLNQNACGWYIHLYYSKSNQGNLKAKLYTGFNVSGSRDNGVPIFDVKNGKLVEKEGVCNLNRGHPGRDLFLNSPMHKHNMLFKQINSTTQHEHYCNDCKLKEILDHKSASNTNNVDDNYHWGQCEDCKQILQQTAHTFIRSSTSESDHSRVCSVCHKVVSNRHTQSTYYTVDDDNHMWVCTDVLCGYSVLVPHTWINPRTLVVATAEGEGIVEYTCRDCSAHKRVFVPFYGSGQNGQDSMSEEDTKELDESMVQESIEEQAQQCVDVYSLDGQCIRRAVDARDVMKMLQPGQVYIINGKRIMVTK